MKFLLDTNIVSILAPGRKRAVPIDPRVEHWLKERDDLCCVATITVTEIENGIQRLRLSGAQGRADDLSVWLLRIVDLYRDRILDLDVATAKAAGVIEANAISIGRSPGLADVLIAATARTWQLTLLTRNLRHFLQLGVPAIDPFVELPA